MEGFIHLVFGVKRTENVIHIPAKYVKGAPIWQFAFSDQPAFAFSDCDVAGCLGYAFDVFCVTALSVLASQSLMVLNC